MTLRLAAKSWLRYDSPEAWLELYEQSFGPIVTARATLGDRWPEARAEVIELATSTSLAEDGLDGPRVRVSADDRADGRCVSRASQTSQSCLRVARPMRRRILGLAQTIVNRAVFASERLPGCRAQPPGGGAAASEPATRPAPADPERVRHGQPA